MDARVQQLTGEGGQLSPERPAAMIEPRIRRYCSKLQYRAPFFSALGRATDPLSRLGTTLLKWSAQVIAAVTVFNKFGIQAAIDRMSHNSIHAELSFISANIVIIVGISYIFGLSMKSTSKMTRLLSGGGWIPTSRPAKIEELSSIHRLYSDIFAGHQLMPFPVFEDLSTNNLLTTYIVFKTLAEQNRREISGYFALQYLSPIGLENVVSGRKDGRFFDSKDLTSDLNSASAIYVGAMGGRTFQDKGFVLTELLHQSQKAPHLRLLGRPATPDGRRVARKYGWSHIPGPDGKPLEVWEGVRPLD